MVRTLGVTSNFELIQCGVPQGSILGPMLFISYINDLENILNTASISLYADDTVMIMLDLHVELSSVNKWLNANKLTLNTDTAKYMVLGSKHMLQHKLDSNFKIGGQKH